MMKSKLLLFVASVLVSPVVASAKDIAVTFNDADQQALIQAVDLALKNSGIQALPIANRLIQKMQPAPERAGPPSLPPPQK